MAAVATILGGIVGYILAIVAYVILGTGLMTAIAVWTLGGIAFLAVAFLASRLARDEHPATAEA